MLNSAPSSFGVGMGRVLVVESASATRQSIKAGEASASLIFLLNIIK